MVVKASLKAGVFQYHLCGTRNLEIETINSLFECARWIKSLPRAEAIKLRQGAIIGIMFYQNSTRTRLSFEAAIRGIGGTSIGFPDAPPARTALQVGPLPLNAAVEIDAIACRST